MVEATAKNGRKPKQVKEAVIAPSNDDLKLCMLKFSGGMERVCEGYAKCLEAPGLTDIQRLAAYEKFMTLLFRGGDKDGITEDNVQLVSDDDLLKVIERNIAPNG